MAMHTPSTNGDFRPTASWDTLRLRAEFLRRLREFFDARGFLEVQTPILSADTVVDRHLDPFRVQISAVSQAGEGSGARAADSGQSRDPTPSPEQAFCPHPSPLPERGGTVTNPQSLIPNPSRYWLQTSPEFAMKRLLAAGAGPIYEVARVFRRDEIGPLHNPEFTLVEWYQPGESLEQGMQLTSDLCEMLLEKRGQTPFAGCQKLARDPCSRNIGKGVAAKGACPLFSAGPAERISYREAFLKYAGLDPHTADARQLVEAVRRLGIEAPATMPPEDRDGWLDLILVERIQSHLGLERPTLLYDYPASQAALARIRHDDPPVAERFELYVAGIELANGYNELLDPQELRRRNAAANAQRRAEEKEALPEESRLLQAMQSGLPAATGVALGFDRLVMLAAGATSIAEVMAFPFHRA